ncbi:MAG: hypothetical protein U5L72_10430 [Bacteroidales bacterium]|nr:hypothetical protein [Bacteroidales bacterium]
MKQFDEEFGRKAKEAFDNFNAEHLAEEGWNSYTRKYGKRPTRPFIIPLWARVASVAAILTLVVLLTNRITHTSADEPGNQLAQENRSGLTDHAINKEDTAVASPGIADTGSVAEVAAGETTVTADSGPVIEAAAGETTVIASSGKASKTITSKVGQSNQTGREKPGGQINDAAGPVLAEAVKAEKSQLTGADEAGGSHLTEADKAGESLLAENSMAPEMKLSENPAEIRLTDATDTGLKLKPKEAAEDFFDLPRERMATTILTGLSGMMASIDNTTSASQGVSIGFYVEQQLTRRISVRPGLAMAKHNRWY